MFYNMLYIMTTSVNKRVSLYTFIEQAIEEYQEYTGLDYDEAVGFIKEL